MPELAEVLQSIDRRLASIENQLRTADQLKAEARSSVDLTLAMSQDDPLAALQERNKQLKKNKSH